jgi:hypothetical protein
MIIGQPNLAMCQAIRPEKKPKKLMKLDGLLMACQCAHMDQCDGIKANPMHPSHGPVTFATKKQKKNNANLHGMYLPAMAHLSHRFKHE